MDNVGNVVIFCSGEEVVKFSKHVGLEVGRRRTQFDFAIARRNERLLGTQTTGFDIRSGSCSIMLLNAASLGIQT
jgi:hypothetical protein